MKMRTNELERSNGELRKLNQMENEFIGIINHELKNPITTVLSGIEVIKARGIDKLDENQKKLLSVMETSTQDMLRLTNNLLDVSTIESGKFEICPENVPFVSILEEVVQALKPEADRKKIRIKTKIDDSINDIYADSVRLKQVLFNVIDNAIKYTGENGTVDISANDGGKNIKIDVKDTGIGIKKEHLIDIFEKFAKRAAGYRGTGLGLYISKSLVESHNGKIKADSDYGKGSVFSIVLPKAQAAI
jgi:signal transduction histidine kinase